MGERGLCKPEAEGSSPFVSTKDISGRRALSRVRLPCLWGARECRGVSRYRTAKDLWLNRGILHAFLAQGNPSKLSLTRAFDLLEYLEAA